MAVLLLSRYLMNPVPRISFAKGQVKVDVDLDEVWQVSYGLTLRPPERPIVTTVTIELRDGVAPPPGGLQSDTIRRVRITDHFRHLDAMVRSMRQPPRDPALMARWRQEVEFRENWLRWSGLGPVLDEPPRLPHAGRPKLSDEALMRAVDPTTTWWRPAVRGRCSTPPSDSAAA